MHQQKQDCKNFQHIKFHEFMVLHNHSEKMYTYNIHFTDLLLLTVYWIPFYSSQNPLYMSSCMVLNFKLDILHLIYMLLYILFSSSYHTLGGKFWEVDFAICYNLHHIYYLLYIIIWNHNNWYHHHLLVVLEREWNVSVMGG